jgi:hypothetical protein
VAEELTRADNLQQFIAMEESIHKNEQTCKSSRNTGDIPTSSRTAKYFEELCSTTPHTLSGSLFLQQQVERELPADNTTLFLNNIGVSASDCRNEKRRVRLGKRNRWQKLRVAKSNLPDPYLMDNGERNAYAEKLDGLTKYKEHRTVLRNMLMEYYTPRKITERINQFWPQGISLDPASSHIANEEINAKTYFTKEDAGWHLPVHQGKKAQIRRQWWLARTRASWKL